VHVHPSKTKSHQSTPPPKSNPGFGHYLNEARAAAALVITTDHPPMDEMVTKSSGLLIAPERTGSYKEQALRDHGEINAFLSPRQICDGVDRALNLGPAEWRARGRAARRDFLRERAEFVARAAELRASLRGRLAAVLEAEGVAAAGAGGGGAGGGGGSGELKLPGAVAQVDDGTLPDWMPREAAKW
jgi:hypothetical protein